MNRKTVVSSLFFFLYAPLCGMAQTIPLSVLNAQGTHAVSCAEGRSMVRDTQRLFQRVGVHISLRHYQCRQNPWKRPLKLTEESIGDVHWFFDEEWFVGSRYRGSKWLHHVILPPILDQEGSRWLAGYSYLSCYRAGKNISTSNATMQSAQGISRYRHSVIAMAHELGHLLGADHDDSFPASIMHSAAMHYVDGVEGWMSFSRKSIEEFLSCKVPMHGG